MRLLHTSDWHLGHTLYGRPRAEEFSAFLDWLLDLVQDRKIDVLLVAGDVFDTSSPGTGTQEMYYNFLYRVSAVCRQTIIVAGNHDSPSFLDAPRSMLRFLNVHVVGTADPQQELVVVSNKSGKPEMIVLAVPFLRDRDIRLGEIGESAETKEQKTVEGIRRHYSELYEAAEQIRREKNPDMPIIASGHLFVAGGKTSEGVRETHVGTLEQLGNDIFPEEIDYLALGHLHVPQLVKKISSRRYCGSPLLMSFDEVGRKKNVVLVDFENRVPRIEEISVPCFSKLLRVQGNMEEIERQLKNILPEPHPVFVEVLYTGTETVPDLTKKTETWIEDRKGKIEILRVRNEQVFMQARLRAEPTETLEDLTPEDVFGRLLDEVRGKNLFDESMESELKNAYNEIVEECREGT